MTDFNELYEKYSKYQVTEYPVRHKRKNMAVIDVKISTDSREKILKIREMDKQLGETMLSFEDYSKLVLDAHASNVHWSTKMEGNTMSLNEVRKTSQILLNDMLLETNPGPTQEILNHLLSCFLKKGLNLPWDIEFITTIHSTLMTGTGEKCFPGEIRSTSISVKTENGQESFIACPYNTIKEELNVLLEWLEYSPLDPIVTAIVFFHEFESIHPFVDGNGRTGRTLFHVLMQQLGFRNFNLCIIDVKLLGNSSLYYSLMEYTDKYADYSPLVGYFIDCIFYAYEEALSLFSEKDLLKDLDENSKAIAKKARSINNWFSLRDANTWVPGVSDQTLRIKLEELIEKNLLEKEGNTRSTRYRFKDPFRKLRKMVTEKASSKDIDLSKR